jgi:hypothetical protein
MFKPVPGDEGKMRATGRSASHVRTPAFPTRR